MGATNVSKMQGISASIEKRKSAGRYNRKFCIHNENGICYNGKINCYASRCVGSFQCEHYKDKREPKGYGYKECRFYINGKCNNEYSDLYLLKCINDDRCLDKKFSVEKKNIYYSTIQKERVNNISLIGYRYILKDLKEKEILEIMFVEDKFEDVIEGLLKESSPIGEAIKKFWNKDIIEVELKNEIIKYQILKSSEREIY